MSGNLTISKAGEACVVVQNTNTGAKVSIDSAGTYHGVYSNGYWDGQTFHSDGKWMIYRNTDGKSYLIGTADNAKNDAAGNSITATYVHKAGDTMTGRLTIADGNLYVNTGYAAIGQSSIYSVLPGSSSTASFRFNIHGDTYSSGWLYTGGGVDVRKASTTAPYTYEAYNNGVRYASERLFAGSSSTVGYAQLLLGNDRASTTADNARGQIVLYSNGTAYSTLVGTYGTLGGTTRTYIAAGFFSGTQLWGAVYNDYAEFRETKNKIEPGYCVVEQGDGSLELSTERLMRGGEIVSDTYGFAIGETEKAKTPIATSGRVLAYCYEGQEYAKDYIGWPVGTGPNGTVSIMTEEEEKLYPSRIIGIISEIPNYDEWQCGSKDEPEYVKVNGRIWIRIR